MEKLEIRVDRGQLSALIDALATAVEHKPGDPLAADWEQLGSWLSHRYTRRWGLPARAARAASAMYKPDHHVTLASGETAWCSCPRGQDHDDWTEVT